MTKDPPRFSATPGKSTLLVLIFVSTVYINSTNYSLNNIVSDILVICLSSLAMYAVMTHSHR